MYKNHFNKQVGIIFTKEVYEILNVKYELFQPARESFFHILSNICSKYNIKGTLKIKSEPYKIKNDGLVDSIKYLLRKTGTTEFDGS